MEPRRQGELDQEFRPLERGWCLDSKPFGEEMVRHVQEQRGQWHYGADLWESAQAKAQQVG
jgi:hypothetical protein